MRHAGVRLPGYATPLPMFSPVPSSLPDEQDVYFDFSDPDHPESFSVSREQNVNHMHVLVQFPSTNHPLHDIFSISPPKNSGETPIVTMKKVFDLWKDTSAIPVVALLEGQGPDATNESYLRNFLISLLNTGRTQTVLYTDTEGPSCPGVRQPTVASDITCLGGTWTLDVSRKRCSSLAILLDDGAFLSTISNKPQFVSHANENYSTVHKKFSHHELCRLAPKQEWRVEEMRTHPGSHAIPDTMCVLAFLVGRTLFVAPVVPLSDMLRDLWDTRVHARTMPLPTHMHAWTDFLDEELFGENLTQNNNQMRLMYAAWLHILYGQSNLVVKSPKVIKLLRSPQQLYAVSRLDHVVAIALKCDPAEHCLSVAYGLAPVVLKEPQWHMERVDDAATVLTVPTTDVRVTGRT